MYLDTTGKKESMHAVSSAVQRGKNDKQENRKAQVDMIYEKIKSDKVAEEPDGAGRSPGRCSMSRVRKDLK